MGVRGEKVDVRGETESGCKRGERGTGVRGERKVGRKRGGGRENGGLLWSREGFEKGGRESGERNRCEIVG